MNTVSRAYRRRIGEILVGQGVITPDQLDEALAVQKKTGELLGSVLMDLGFVSEADVAKTICIQYQLPFITLSNYDFDKKLVDLFPREFLTKHKLLPFDKIGDTLLVLVTEIPANEVLAEIPRLTKLNAGLYVGYASEVEKYLFGDGDAHGRTSAGTPVPPKPARKAVVQSRVTREEEEYDSQDADEPETEDQDQALVFGEGDSFLKELDSTWDSIFTEPSSDKDKDEGGDADSDEDR